MDLTPDTIVLWEYGGFRLNATIVNTWIVMAVLTLASWLVTRRLRPDVPPGRWRTLAETIVLMIEEQIRSITPHAVHQILYLAGSLFLFIATAGLLGVVPGFRSPTGSLSTTLALTLVVLFAVPAFSISHGGFRVYLRNFIQPSILLLPLNLLGEASKVISLSIRLYGNVMSSAVIVAILLSIAPFFFPVIMDLFGLLIGMIQAYIFAVLATVYISAAMSQPRANPPPEDSL
ncbi:MAG: F0F1 ATP synthase subunit A [Gammaproteobacteria bacterium]|nr:F0F1 ATP synthase subunit A [Gammaproteobacteria bacterium]